MMSNFFNNPENALKRANEFLELGKEDESMDCLCDILKFKKNRILKNVHEAVIYKLLDICVDRKMSSIAKDGLYSYRILCFGINIKSWEDAVRRLISLAEQKIEINTEDLFKYDAGTVCSLDETVTPEYLLKLVNDRNNDKDDKWIALFPWIKFNFECYRFCLDLLKNNQAESFYHYVARKSLHFCQKYHLKTEFHKLCHVLRVHLGYLYKQTSQILSNVNNTETLMLYLETETIELEIALDLELWQEVYKAIENLHFLIEIVKRHGSSKIIANYYKQLCHVFLKTGDLLYHAAALFRYFCLTRELKKSLGPAEVTALSSTLVLSVLAIPLSPNDLTIDQLAEKDFPLTEKKHRLLSEFLNFSNKLTRKTLLKDIKHCGVVQTAQVEVQGLFHLLENELDPLNMGNRILCLTKAFSETSVSNQKTLNLYLNSILDLSVTILLSQLSKIYESMTWEKFKSLVPLSDEFHVEWLVVETGRRYNIPVRLDHLNACLRFDTSYIFHNSSTEGGIEVRQLPVDKSMNYLSQVYTSLKQIGRQLDPEYFKGEEIAVRNKITEQYLQEFGEDRIDILQRKKIIERHKEMVEKIRLKKEEDERNLIAAKQLEFEIAEKQRLLKEAEQRAQQKLILQQEEIRKKILYEKIEILKKSELGEMIGKLEINELEDLDPEVILSKHFEQVIREKKGLTLRLQKQERTTNHMERAKRIEEVPLLEHKYEEEKDVSKSTWEKDEKRRIETALEERAHNVRKKERLLVMKDHLNEFVGKIRERNKLEYLEKCNDFQITLEQEREKRLKERAVKRKEQRRLQWIEEQEAAKRFRTKREIAEERKELKINKFKKETSSYSEVKCNSPNDYLIRDNHNKSSGSFMVYNKNLSKNPQGYISSKYQHMNQTRETSVNKRYEDQNEVNDGRKFERQISPKPFTRSIGSYSRSQTDKADCDYYAPDRSYKEFQMNSISMYREKNNRSPDAKEQVQKENAANYYQRKSQQKYILSRPEESSFLDSKTSNKYIPPRNKFSEPGLDDDKPKNTILDNYKYPKMLEPNYRSNKETFTTFKAVPDSDATTHLGALYKQEKSRSFDRDTLNPQDSREKFGTDFVRRNEAKSNRYSLQDEKDPTHTTKISKFEVRHSCTPWAKAKLHRGKEQ